MYYMQADIRIHSKESLDQVGKLVRSALQLPSWSETANTKKFEGTDVLRTTCLGLDCQLAFGKHSDCYVFSADSANVDLLDGSEREVDLADHIVALLTAAGVASERYHTECVVNDEDAPHETLADIASDRLRLDFQGSQPIVPGSVWNYLGATEVSLEAATSSGRCLGTQVIMSRLSGSSFQIRFDPPCPKKPRFSWARHAKTLLSDADGWVTSLTHE